MRESVAQLVKKYAYRHFKATGKRYTLASGKQSDEYVDVKSLLLHPVAGAALVDHIAAAYPPSEGLQAVAGLEFGGALLAKMLATKFKLPAMVVRKPSRRHGAAADGVEGLDNLGPGPHRVWFVEDVVTTGESGQAALDVLATHRTHSFVVERVIAVVDRGGQSSACYAFNSLWVSLTTIEELRETS